MRLPSGPAPAVLFELLAGERTGIDLAPRFPANASLEMLQDQRSGSGVCVGDFDNDGHPDVYLTNYQAGNRLYRNLGDWRFEDVTASAGVDGGGRWCGGASFADIDNDGDLDLFVCAFNAPNLLYVNQGNGTFAEAAAKFGLNFSGASVMMAFADYDRDGLLDAFLVTSRLSMGAAERLPKSSQEALRKGMIRVAPGGRVSVDPRFRELFDTLDKGGGRSELIIAGQIDNLYRNTGTNFVVMNASAGIGGNHIGLAATWWDYNEDGWPDLYVSNDYKGPDQLYRNNRDGTFTDVAAEVLPCVPWSSMGTDLADINNDGRVDFIATDMAGSDHARRVLNYSDPDKDLWFMLLAHPQQYRRNTVYLNTGTARLGEVAYLTGLASTDWTWSPKFGDFDNDGWIDLFISNGMSRDFIDRDLMRRGEDSGGWRNAPVRREPNLAFRNLGDLRFSATGPAWGLDQNSASYGAALADLDRDGDLDLVVSNFDEPVSVFRNNGTAGNRILIRLRGTRSNSHGLGARVVALTSAGTQVRSLTLARGFMSADEPLIHLGLGTDPSIRRLTVDWPSGHVQSFEHLAANHFYMITEPAVPVRGPQAAAAPPTFFSRLSWLADIRHAENDYDDYVRQPLLPYKLSQLGPGVACGDVNGDGLDDLYFGGAAGQSGSLCLRVSGGAFRTVTLPALAADALCEDMAALFLDVDSDGDMDLFVVSGGAEHEAGSPLLRDRMYLNDGRGAFQRAPDGTLPDLRDAGGVAAAADFDRDGDLDLFVGGRCIPGHYPLIPSSRLLRNANGVFSDVTSAIAPDLSQAGLVTSALWSDVDNDGWIDLLVTLEWGPVRFYRNVAGKLEDWTDRSGLAQWTGWWNGIAAGDLDADGDLDYLVTNFGLNTRYTASPEAPALLFHGDFGGAIVPQLIEAFYENGVLYPLRGKSTLTAATPPLIERYPTFRAFASASVEDLYGSARLQASRRLEINTLESAVFLNQGNGRFDRRPLPRFAQMAPGFGVAVADVDGDGALDAYIVHNFNGPQPETGRMNGGLSCLLRGNNSGHFIPVWPDASGCVVPEDAKALSVTDLDADGRPDFIVSVNQGHPIALRNSTASTNRFQGIRLRGARGNPTAVGARVTLTRSDQSKQVAEVYAGGGYLSQSTRDLFFGMGPSNRIAHIAVRWPDGQTSETVTPSESGPLVLSHPQR